MHAPTRRGVKFAYTWRWEWPPDGIRNGVRTHLRCPTTAGSAAGLGNDPVDHSVALFPRLENERARQTHAHGWVIRLLPVVHVNPSKGFVLLERKVELDVGRDLARSLLTIVLLTENDKHVALHHPLCNGFSTNVGWVRVNNVPSLLKLAAHKVDEDFGAPRAEPPREEEGELKLLQRHLLQEPAAHRAQREPSQLATASCGKETGCQGSR